MDISNNYEYGTGIQKFFPLFMYIIDNLNMLNSWIYVIQHIVTFFLHLLSLR